MNDSVKIQQSVLQIVNILAIDIVTLIVALVFVFNISINVGFLSTILIPIFSLIIWKYIKPVKEANRDVMTKYAIVESNYVDHITGIDTIKSENREDLFGDINKSLFKHFQDSIVHLGRIDIKVGTIAEMITGIFLISILSSSAFLSINGEFTTGDMMSMFTILGTLIPSIIRIALINLSVQQALVSFDRLFEFMALAPEQKLESADTVQEFESLELKKINFRYNSRKQILFNINMQIQKGQMVALVGESGSGKTTIGLLIEEFYKLETGEILWNGHKSYKLSKNEIRSKIGFVPQDIKIFNGTVLDNIILGKNYSKDDVDKFCMETGLSSFIESLPNGLFTLVGEEGINLSGGQKQIIAITRALYKKPEILILDEATSAMDMETEAMIKSVLSNLKLTTLIIAHRLTTIRNADYIYVMKDGRIIEEGNHQQLMKITDSYYKRLNDFQAGMIYLNKK